LVFVSTFLPSLLPSQPTSTLFPYTTLFRSDITECPEKLEFIQIEPHFSHLLFVKCFIQHSIKSRKLKASKSPIHQSACIREGNLDRKSTRLNSSHRTISYAVFCLKKKRNFR